MSQLISVYAIMPPKLGSIDNEGMNLTVRQEQSGRIKEFLSSMFFISAASRRYIQIKEGSCHPKNSRLEVCLFTSNDFIEEKALIGIPGNLGFS